MSGRTGVRLRGSRGGSDVTMSGSCRVFSEWSSAATRSFGTDISIGFEKTRVASPPHSGQAIADGALPSGRVMSNAPCSLAAELVEGHGRAQFAVIGTLTSCDTWCGLPLDGATSKSKIRRGMYTVAQEFGMSTTPEKRPSIGAEPRIM